MRTTNGCFGIFSFSEGLKARFDVLVKPIVETHTGLHYWDARKLYESQQMKMSTITRMIEEARLVIVDISENKPNVFIEIGIALALNKRIVFLCDEAAHKSVWPDGLPFDLRGREFLIYKDEQDLKVRLGEALFDSIHDTCPTALSWFGETNGEAVRNQCKSATEIELLDEGVFWCQPHVESFFTVQYRAQLRRLRADDKRPDLRLHIAPCSNSDARILCILPWELVELEEGQRECHIDYFFDFSTKHHVRLQQASICSESAPLTDFRVFVSFCSPNLVVESSLFDDNISRLVVPINQFYQRGFDPSLSHRIGFQAVNADFSIHEIQVKAVRGR